MVGQHINKIAHVKIHTNLYSLRYGMRVKKRLSNI